MGKSVTVTPVLDESAWDSISGRDDPGQRYRIYRLCECFRCGGRGKWALNATVPVKWERCPECRGEGRVLDLVATCPNPQALGTAIVRLGQEGEFEECPIGVLDREGETGKKWLILPWLPSPRNVSEAARTLARAKEGRE